MVLATKEIPPPYLCIFHVILCDSLKKAINGRCVYTHSPSKLLDLAVGRCGILLFQIENCFPISIKSNDLYFYSGEVS